MNTPESCKCPSCAGSLLFDIGLQRLRCDHCSRELTVPEYESLLQDNPSFPETRGASPAQDGGYRRRVLRRSYVCATCGGEVSPGVLSASASCPFCGRPIVLSDKIRDTGEPDMIIPFQKQKGSFVEGYRKLFAGRHFVPADFLREAREEKILARYFPFWIFDVTATGSARAKGEKISRKGDRKWEHRVFELSGAGHQEFNGVPQDATDELDDELSQRLEPFDTASAVPYSFAYFAGHDVRIGNRGSGKSFKDVERRITGSLDRLLIPAGDYDACRITERNYTVKPRLISSAMFPVYLLDVPWRGRIYKYAMNGQTGRIVGKFPVKGLNVGMCSLFLTCVSVLILFWLGELADFLPGMSQLLIFLPMLGLVAGVCWAVWKSPLPFVFENSVLAVLGGAGSITGTLAYALMLSSRDSDTRTAVLILGFFGVLLFFLYHSILRSRLEDEARDSLTGLAPDADDYLDPEQSAVTARDCREAGSYVADSERMRRD